MTIQVGTRVRIDNEDHPAHGLTGVVDEIDGGYIPFHVRLDIPRDDIITWFMEWELVEEQVTPQTRLS